VFGEDLSADPRNGIPLLEKGRVRGGVHCLFTGPTLHVLLERRRRLGDAYGAAASVIAQVAATRKAYIGLGLHALGGRAACRVESMVFAEAMSAAAEARFLGAGIYVLRPADMTVRAPAVRAPACEM
jgi:hypothetical protein